MNKNETNDDNVSSDDDIKASDLVKRTFIDSNSVEISKGDKIRVIKGELIDLSGIVVTIEDGQVIFKPNTENIDVNLTLDKSFVVKFFEPGDDVRVIDGQYKGETGLVARIEGRNAYISLD